MSEEINEISMEELEQAVETVDQEQQENQQPTKAEITAEINNRALNGLSLLFDFNDENVIAPMFSSFVNALGASNPNASYIDIVRAAFVYTQGTLAKLDEDLVKPIELEPEFK